ncbi:MAG: M1 family aminopeptidase [Phycisphaerales bacterium JB037]
MTMMHRLATPTAILALAAGLASARLDRDEFLCRHEHAARTAMLALQPAGSRDASFDASTGKDLLNYPPHRVADFEHMKLEITIADMNTPRFEAISTLTLAPVGYPLAELPLNADLLQIKRVESPGHATRWEYDGRMLRVIFDPPVPVGESCDVVIHYAANDPTQGLKWTPESPAWPGRPAQLHTQGQPETNSFWFPCHDFPNERLTTEIIIAVPEGYVASSNGRLESIEKGWLGPYADSPAVDIFHFMQDKPHPNYLVSLIVGKFDIVDVGTRGFKAPVYVPPGRGSDVEGTYGMTMDMVRLYERLFDEPYPWDRYAQLVVWNFDAGGMENTAATTMFDTAIIARDELDDNELDGLIAHELAHQWFGDYITCNSWEHIWLNEGFATYLESLWFEERDGIDGYHADVLANFDAIRAADRGVAPFTPGMVSKEYTDPFQPFFRGANPYPKGASIMHMLRTRLGEEVFFEAMRLYTDRFALSTVRTSDFRKTLEEVSGENLERFFHEYTIRPNIPRVRATPSWDAGSGVLTLTLEQTQPIDPRNPAFGVEMNAKIGVGGRTRDARISFDTRTAELRFALPAEPEFIALNHDLSCLSELEVVQPADRWLRQLDAGLGLPSAVQAIRHLGTARDTEPGTNGRLDAIVRDRDLHPTIRQEAAEALGQRAAFAEILDLLEVETPADPYVRETIVRTAAGMDWAGPERSTVAGVLATAVETDSSTRVRAASLRGLATMNATDYIPLVLAATEQESQHDRVRQAALDALASLDAPTGLDAAIRIAQPGFNYRTRSTAVRALSALAHHDRNAAYRALEPLLLDRERRTVEAAGRALVDLGDPRAAQALRRYLDTVARDDRQRAWAQGLLDELAGGG